MNANVLTSNLPKFNIFWFLFYFDDAYDDVYHIRVVDQQEDDRMRNVLSDYV